MICPACGGQLAPWLEATAGEPSDPRLYPLLRCALCGSAVTGGEPPSAELYESGMYSEDEPRASWLVDRFQRAVAAEPLRPLRRAGVSPGARVLDAGAGRGRLVRALRDAGYDAQGIEPSRRSARIAARSGEPVKRRALEQHEESGLDAVILWHVLEHLEDPAGALRRIRSWLRPGGVLVLGVPNVRSWQARIAGGKWLHLDPPRHRVHFTVRGLRRLLERSGFEPRGEQHLVWEQNPHAMWMSILVRLGMTPGYPLHLLKRSVEPNPRDLALLAAGIPLLPFAVALELLAAAVRRGGTIALSAARR